MNDEEAEKLVRRTSELWSVLEARIEDARNEQLRLLAELNEEGLTNYRIAKYWHWPVSQTTVGKWVRWGKALTQS